MVPFIYSVLPFVFCFCCQNNKDPLFSKIIKIISRIPGRRVHLVSVFSPYKFTPETPLIRFHWRFLTQLIDDFVDDESTANFSVLNSIMDLFLYSTSISNICSGVQHSSSPGTQWVWGRERVVHNKRKGGRGHFKAATQPDSKLGSSFLSHGAKSPVIILHILF